jgi:D-3-phosphoglycerate dehydrogenase
MLILALSKNLIKADQAVRSGDWMFRDRHLPSEIMGKTVFLIGFGNNAKETAKILQNAFSMNIKAYDPFVSSREMETFRVTKIEDLYSGFENSKYISVHVPYTPSTHHFINEKAFSKMQNVIFINCSRGAVVDTKSLCQAIKNGNVARAGLDVFEDEPLGIDSAILKLENVIVTPHFAGDTLEAKQRCAFNLAQNMILALNGKLPKGLYNQEVKQSFISP